MHEASRQRSIIVVLVAVALVAAAAAWAMTGSASDSPGSGQGSPASSESSGAAAAGDDTGSTGAGETGSSTTGAGKSGSGGGDSGTDGAGAGKSGSQGSGASGGGADDQGSDQGGEGNGQGNGKDDGNDGGDTGGDDATTDVEEPGTATGETVPVEPVQTMAPVPLQSVGDFKTGLTVELASITAVQAEAKAPGEISGPGLRVTVAASNDGEDAVSLDGVVVFLSYGSDRTPATQFGSSSEPLAGDLPSGSSRQGTYVFTVPTDQRDDVRVEVSYTGSAPTVAFTGSVDG
jgi:hypothetical protein